MPDPILSARGLVKSFGKVRALRDRLEQGLLKNCKGATINGKERLPNTLNVSFEFVEGEGPRINSPVRRAADVDRMLRNERTAFVVVTSPRSEALREAGHGGRLEAQDLSSVFDVFHLGGRIIADCAHRGSGT